MDIKKIEKDIMQRLKNIEKEEFLKQACDFGLEYKKT